MARYRPQPRRGRGRTQRNRRRRGALRTLPLRERPQRRALYSSRGLPMYPLAILGSPPTPPEVSRSEFDDYIAHDVERNFRPCYECWQGTRESVGDIMEYEFRVRFPLPIHIPRSAMKTIFLMVADEDMNEFIDDLWWTTPLENAVFEWPRPFRWPIWRE